MTSISYLLEDPTCERCEEALEMLRHFRLAKNDNFMVVLYPKYNEIHDKILYHVEVKSHPLHMKRSTT